MKSYTSKQINTHLAKFDIESFKPSLAKAISAKATPEEVTAKICGTYQVVKPILLTVSSLFFIPAKWRSWLKLFTSALDGLCPGDTV